MNKTVTFLTIIFTSFLSVSGALFYFSTLPDFCCDVYQYIHIAQSMDANGLFFKHSGSDIRMYFYPYLLSIFAKDYIYSLTLFLEGTRNFLVFLVFASSLLFNYSMLSVSKNRIVSNTVTLFVFLNPLIATIYTLPLTELYVYPLFIIFISLSILSLGDNVRFEKYSFSIVIALCLSCLILLRPANLILLFPILMLFIYLYRSHSVNFACIALFIFFFMLPFIPQLLFNLSVYNEVSFLPVGGLGGKQFTWGLMYAKYGTYYADGVAEGIKYRTWLSDDVIAQYSNSSALLFYVKEFPDSIFLLLSHLFNSLNYDFLYTYVNDYTYAIFSWYQVLSSLMTVLGFTYVGYLVFSFKDYNYRKYEYYLLIVLLFFMGMNAFVAVETRFGMIPHAIFTIFSMLLIYNWKLVKDTLNYKVVLVLGMFYMTVSVYLSYYFVSKIEGVNITWL